jgi:hypothetical protein
MSHLQIERLSHLQIERLAHRLASPQPEVSAQAIRECSHVGLDDQVSVLAELYKQCPEPPALLIEALRPESFEFIGHSWDPLKKARQQVSEDKAWRDVARTRSHRRSLGRIAKLLRSAGSLSDRNSNEAREFVAIAVAVPSVLPHLTSLLEQPKYADPKCAFAELLGCIGRERDEVGGLLVSWLRYPNKQVAEAAARAVGRMGDLGDNTSEGVQALVDLGGDHHWYYRDVQSALGALLWGAHGEEVLDALVERIENGGVVRLPYWFQGLQHANDCPRVTKVLAKNLKHPDAMRRVWAATASYGTHDRDLALALERVANDPVECVRSAAVKGLINSLSPSATPTISAAILDPDIDVRLAAAEALYKRGFEGVEAAAVLQPFKKLLQDLKERATEVFGREIDGGDCEDLRAQEWRSTLDRLQDWISCLEDDMEDLEDEPEDLEDEEASDPEFCEG